jgi:4-amino-4-deoxy-L-arabinose transferase-like glycosyltransferase
LLSTPYPLSKAARLAALVVLVSVALYFRVWGLAYGLPALHHPDEPNKVSIAQDMIRSGDPNPHYFKKGTMLIYATAAAQAGYYGWGRVAGWFDEFDDVAAPKFLVYGTGWTSQPGTFLVARWMSVLLGVGCVLLIHAIASKIGGDARAGLAAAAVASVAPTAVEHSRYITVDVYATFFCLVVVLFSLRLYDSGRFRDAMLAGIATGLAAGSKYPAALAGLAPALAQLLGAGRRSLLGAWLALPLAAALGFLATTPFALVAWPEFRRDFVHEQQHYTTGHVGMEGATASYYGDQLWNVEGATVCVLAAAGLFLVVRRRPAAAAVLLVFPVVYFASIVGLPVRNARTLLPALPFFYVLAGVAVAEAFGLLERLGRGRRVALVAALAAFVWMLSFPAARSAEQGRRAASLVAVESARRWVIDHVPAGSRVLLESYAPYVDPERYRVRAQPFLVETAPSTIASGFDYVIAARRSYGRFYRNPVRYRAQVEAYDRLFASMTQVASFRDFGSEIRIFKVGSGAGGSSGAVPPVAQKP